MERVAVLNEWEQKNGEVGRIKSRRIKKKLPILSITAFYVYGFSAFLSRLCGGEDMVVMVKSQAIFLSRLCGGE